MTPGCSILINLVSLSQIWNSHCGVRSSSHSIVFKTLCWECWKGQQIKGETQESDSGERKLPVVGEQNPSVVELCPGQAKILWSRAGTKTGFVAVPSVPHDALKTVTMKSFRLSLYLMQTLNRWWNVAQSMLGAVSSLLVEQSTHPSVLVKRGE